VKVTRFAKGDRVWYLGDGSPVLYGRVATVVDDGGRESVRIQFDHFIVIEGNQRSIYSAFRKNLHKLSLLEQIAEAARDDT